MKQKLELVIWKTEQLNAPNRAGKKLKSEENLWELWDNIKQNIICILEVPEVEEREKGS